jgi:5-methyltetrahydrofolate corrinoid/iron sulfur protein methyltransferase
MKDGEAGNMQIISSNLTTRDGNVDYLFRQARANGWNPASQTAHGIRELAKQCAAAGADIIELNIQQRHDVPEAMKYAVDAVQQVTDCLLCLSTNNAKALEAGLKACKKPALVNYVSIDEVRLKETLSLAARHSASVVLMVSEATTPTDARDMLQKTAILTGAANEAGITNDRICVDPGLIHISNEAGQHHLVEVCEFLRNLPEATDPPVKSTCWLSNSSTGAPQRLRHVVEITLLPMLAGLGLSSVFMDVLSRENMRTARLLQIFENRRVYSDSELEL